MSNNPIPSHETAGTPSSVATPTPITTPNVSSSKKSLGIQQCGSNNASGSPAPGSSSGNIFPNTPTQVDFEALITKLSDPNGDIKLKVHLITELREMIDLSSRDVEFTKHFDVIILAVVEIISNTRPVFMTSTWDYKYRLILLDILSRIPIHDAMKTHALKVMNMLIDVIRNDNEECVIISFKLGLDLYRSFKGILESTVALFFQTILEMYDLVPATAEEIFAILDSSKANLMRRTASGNPNVSGANPLNGSDSSSTEAIKGMKSFKTLHECPVAVVFLLQTYKTIVQPSLPACLPIIFKAIFENISTTSSYLAWVIAERGQGAFVGVAPTITKALKRAQHTELTIAQVKVMSFIAYVIRAQSPLVQPFGPEIPTIVIRILKDIPPESSLSRRELIVALRHILGTEYRALFIPFLSELLNMRIFMGTGITVFESLRHLVCSTYADLVQHAKPELQANHIKAILVNFIEVLNDPTSSTTTQAMAGRSFTASSIWLLEALADNRAYQMNHQANAQKRSQTSTSLQDKGKGKQVNATSLSDTPTKFRTESGKLAQPDRTSDEAEDILIERGKILGGISAILEPPPEQSKDHLLGRRVITRSCITSFQIVLEHQKDGCALPDAMLLGRLFNVTIRCFAIYDVVGF
ncbi:hypothetical protein H4Q26_011539 [Puccinia striiformis f. sp. tritici PST-130]|nr:hypothetical protein H4Q26_011539 [Puccinia striiformis f. sp. tritici PST-130]